MLASVQMGLEVKKIFVRISVILIFIKCTKVLFEWIYKTVHSSLQVSRAQTHRNVLNKYCYLQKLMKLN